MKIPLNYSSFCTSLIALVSIPALHAGTVSQPISLPTKADLTINEADCQNSGGPNVTLEGLIHLGNVCAKVTLSNNAKGTHTTTVQREYTVSLAIDHAITIPKQPVRGGVGGNPLIYLQFTTAAGAPLSEEIFLGRCVQGLNVSRDIVNDAILTAIVDAINCKNSGGPTITIGGELVLSGLNAKIIFRNNSKGTHTAEATTNVQLIAEGTTITLPKQPSQGGVGGNPLITIQFVNCQTGAALGDPIVLGRCNQL
jgi:hypothetical protein